MNLERGKIIPLEYVGQMAKEIAGIEQAQRYRELDEVKSNGADEAVRVGLFVAANILQPFGARYMETHISVEQLSNAGLLGALVEWGVNIGAILLAINGHVAEGVAVKAAWNTGINVFMGPGGKASQKTS